MGDVIETELCANCQRQIPVDNFTIHSIHCMRNLKVCDKCKEPVPVTDMKKHLEHVACKQCGERMQACDVSPHQREACPETSVTCTYCTLQLARALMRDHETYCGSRTERCEDCRELVMVKYMKLHEESNHGFLKLDDEPGPQPSWMASNTHYAARASVKPLNTGGFTEALPLTANGVRVMPSIRSAARHTPMSNPTQPVGSSTNPSSRSSNETRSFKGGIKKYPAPQPPTGAVPRGPSNSRHNTAFIADNQHCASQPSSSFKHVRDVPMYAAKLREQQQTEERQRQTEVNLAQGLPPVLNPAQKLDKLRKMSSLQNRETQDEFRYRQTSTSVEARQPRSGKSTFTPMSEEDLMARLQNLYNTSTGDTATPPGHTSNAPPAHCVTGGASHQPVDRFSEIKNDLRVLRKELNKCSSPLEPGRLAGAANLSHLPRPVGEGQSSHQVNVAAAATALPRILRDHNGENNKHISDADGGLNCEQGTPRGARKGRSHYKKDKSRLRPERRLSVECATCDFCHRNIPVVEIQDHEIDCQMRMRRQTDTESRAPLGNTVDDDFDSHTPSDLDGVTFPCEFCHQSVPAHMFVTHETGCNPMETSILPPAANRDPARRNTTQMIATNLPSVKNTNLEFLNSQKQVNFQEARRNVNRGSRGGGEQHVIARDGRDEINAEGALGFGEEQVQLPCQFCSSLMPADLLMMHQEQCGM